MLRMAPLSLRNELLRELNECVEACIACALTAEDCAEECLTQRENGDRQWTRCFLSDLECSNMCDLTAQSLQRFTGIHLAATIALVQSCATIAAICGEECSAIENRHDICSQCLTVCKAVQTTCNALLAVLPSVAKTGLFGLPSSSLNAKGTPFTDEELGNEHRTILEYLE